MKRATFKTPFNGKENALKVIPESYKIDGNKFEVTDGNETYIVKWEGSLTEGTASILLEADKNLINEDMQKIKHLMGFKSQDTLGNLKGSERLDENKSFTDVFDKSKKLVNEAFGMGFNNEGNLDGHDEMEHKAPEVREDMVSNLKDETDDANVDETSSVGRLKDRTMDDINKDYKIEDPKIKENGNAQQIADLTGADSEEMGNIQGALDMDKAAGITNEDEISEGAPSIGEIKGHLQSLRTSIGKAKFSELERNVVEEMLTMIEVFGNKGNQFQGNVKPKFMALKSAIDSIETDSASKEDIGAAEQGDEQKSIAQGNVAQTSGLNEDIEEQDTFDKIFEDMYVEELDECDDELTPDQAKEMDTDKDGDIDGKDLSNLRKKK